MEIHLSEFRSPHSKSFAEDGGTHRVAVLAIAVVAGSLFVFGCPIGSYVPKWFLGGALTGTASGWNGV